MKTGIGVLLAACVLAACHDDRITDTPPLEADIEAQSTDYQRIALGTLNGSASSFPNDLDDAGRVVGESDSRAFLWENGVMTQLPSPRFGRADAFGPSGLIGGTAELATTSGVKDRLVVWEGGVLRELEMDTALFGRRVVTINARNDVLGQVYLGDDDAQGMLWPGAAGPGQPLGHLNANLHRTHPWAMNEGGGIVGSSWKNLFGALATVRAFRWRNGRMRDLGVLGTHPCPERPEKPCSFSEALDINDAGVIVGGSQNEAQLLRAVVWRDGVISELNAFFGEQTLARHINGNGDIAGTIGAAQERAFFWRNGVFRELGSLGGGGTRIWAMNENGWIVGSSLVGTSGLRRAFVFRNGRMTKLTALSPNHPVSEARDINSRGDIVGFSGGELAGQSRKAVLWRYLGP